MEKLSAKFLVLLLFSASFLHATTSVTGNVRSLGASTVRNVTVRFYLRGCGGNQPRVTGVGALVPTQGSVWYQDFVSDSSGNISGTLYSTRDTAGTGNGEIECGGSYTAVWYGMQLIQAGKTGPEVPIVAKNGTSFDISNVTPITMNPVIAAPTGDNTYLRLDGGNSPVIGPVVFTGTLDCKNLNNTRCVDGANSQGWAGSDFGAWVNSAIADLPLVLPALNDGVNTYRCGTVNLFPGPTGPNVTVSTTISANSPCLHLVGPGSGSLNLVCPASGDCIRLLSNPFNQNQAAELRGLTLTGNGTAASGIHIGDLTHAVIADVMVQNFTGSVANGLGSAGSTGIWIDNVLGFTEQLQLNHVWLINNTIGIKQSVSTTNCPAFNVSTSYGHWIDVHINVDANQIGLETGPGVSDAHSQKLLFMNGGGTGKTFFQEDAASGLCAAAAVNNGDLIMLTEDNGPNGGTIFNIATGATYSGRCLIHHFNAVPAMTNTINGTMYCQTYYGPPTNQLTLSNSQFSSTVEELSLLSDGAAVNSQLGLGRGAPTADIHLEDIGTAGTGCTGSTQGDFCIRNDNTGNLISLTVGANPALNISQTTATFPMGLTVPTGQIANVSGSLLVGQQIRTPNALFATTAPTIGASHFNTSGDSISSNNGTMSFLITVGNGAGTSTGSITLPTATNGWNCYATNRTRAEVIQQTAESATSATFTNFGATFSATNWTNGDILQASCFGR